MKKWEPSYKRLSLNRTTGQLVLTKHENAFGRATKPQTLDLRLIKEAHTVDYKLNHMKINDKWKRDKEIQRFEAEMLLAVSFGSSFIVNHWLFLCKLAVWRAQAALRDSKY